MSGKIIFDKLANEFELLFDFKATCATVPETSYRETMELKMQELDMALATFPSPDLWRSIQQYESRKFKMKL